MVAHTCKWDTIWVVYISPIGNGSIRFQLSHPSLGWLYVFSSWLLLLTSKLFELDLRYLDKESIGLGKCTGWPLVDLDPRARLWCRLAKICLSVRLSENHSLDHYKTWQLGCPYHGYYLRRFWRSSVENCYFDKFSFKDLDVFFKVKHYFGHISGMVSPIDVKR